MSNPLKKQYLARMKALHAWIRKNEGLEVQTPSFYLDRTAKELYFIQENKPTRVTLASYTAHEVLRNAMTAELAEKIGEAVPRAVIDARDRIELLTEEFRSISEHLRASKYRLKLSREGKFVPVEIIHQAKAVAPETGRVSDNAKEELTFKVASDKDELIAEKQSNA
ncbi:hypothetical protein IQ258_19670 [Coleofasciculus sp. LEGE 07081]|uniref:hypothetical protein n=1 Tax=Coleofasciculus sp. LEGE 07081 TaxID=2777967 RepID=UPI001882ED42|nr:hypothetical protein [Coleofasciculus sp. LEGE 07081]MBE9128322.1 hypothetical protein [Coleofasciculus sp. LEGE 07081]